MRKTTVYLTESEAEALRQRAAATGRSQAELIREAIGSLLGKSPRRRFHSMGSGESGHRAAVRRWAADELYEKAFGQR